MHNGWRAGLAANRSGRQQLGVILSTLNLVHTTVIAVIVGLLWLQVTKSSGSDRGGRRMQERSRRGACMRAGPYHALTIVATTETCMHAATAS